MPPCSINASSYSLCLKYLCIYCSNVVTFSIENLLNEKEMIQPLLQAHISKQKNAFRAKQYKAQQQQQQQNKHK